MGSGKSSAAINYMNSHPDRKFVYITPYLEEAERIRRSCPKLRFKEPNNKLPEYGFKKYTHTVELLTSGENITSTHSMFLRYSDDMIDIIKKHGYTLIIDEAVDVLRQADIGAQDVGLLDSAGWLTKKDFYIDVKPQFDYKEGVFSEVVSLAKGNRLIDMRDYGGVEAYYFWVFSKDILEAFSDVIVLTYLFESQTMKYYMDIHNMTYTKIGVRVDENGLYQFGEYMEYIPEYTATLSSKIHIFENKKLNAVGDNKHALSHSWFAKCTAAQHEKKELLRRNVNNFFINYHRDKPVKRRLWSTYNLGKKILRSKGYFYNDIAFNAKATNDYKDRDVLAYCVNVFMQPCEKNFLIKNGVEVREDEHALSVMIQWIWRSAIREGNEIWIYIPSKRMRDLLKDWIQSVENTYAQTKEIQTA